MSEMKEILDLLILSASFKINQNKLISLLCTNHNNLLTPEIALNILLNFNNLNNEMTLKILEILSQDKQLLIKYVFDKDLINFTTYSTIKQREFILNNIDVEHGKILIDNWPNITYQYEKTKLINEELDKYASDYKSYNEYNDDDIITDIS